MIRPVAAGPLSRALQLARPSIRASIKRPTRPVTPRRSRLALTSFKPFTTSLQRYQTADHIDIKHEKQVGKEHLEKHPEEVSTDSSMHPVLTEHGVDEDAEKEKDIDMLASLKHDLRVVRDTFNLSAVPKEALTIGLAGVLPYMATSLSTVYLAYDINHAEAHGSGLLMDPKTAEVLLHIIEPLQIGYGAVIISFLGAIHWGLEWAKYGGSHGYRRYAYGVVAPAVAWPTTLLPIETALISQFLAFTFLYYADAKSVVRGWTPPWYTTYRFVLTFVVGASIVATLIGRGEIADKINRLPGPADRVKALRDSQAQSLAEEEKAMRERRIAEEEEEDEDEEEEDEE
ncbi:MAG: hypothetical protein Q9195_006476 [Heterodermia aff. obscurata]